MSIFSAKTLELLFVQILKLNYLSKNIWRGLLSKKVTVVLEENLDKKLHKIQEEFMAEYKDPISFSKVLNEILHKGLL